MTEELGFNELPGDCRHIDSHERTFAPPAIVVEGACDKLLAGTGFTNNHHGQISLGEAGNDTVDVLHRRRTAYDREIFSGRHRPR